MDTLIVSPYSRIAEYSEGNGILIVAADHTFMEYRYGCYAVCNTKRVLHSNRLTDPTLTALICHELGHALRHKKDSTLLDRYWAARRSSIATSHLDPFILNEEEAAWEHGREIATSLGLMGFLTNWDAVANYCLNTYRFAFTDKWQDASGEYLAYLASYFQNSKDDNGQVHNG